jgi:hypothetical protein
MTGLTSTMAWALLASLGLGSEPFQDSQSSKARMLDAKALSASQAMAKQAQGKTAAEWETMFVGIGGECHVDSRVNAYIRVYINGCYRGTIPPYGDIYPFVGDCEEDVTELYAVTTCGRYYWSRRVYGAVGDYHWILRP